MGDAAQGASMSWSFGGLIRFARSVSLLRALKQFQALRIDFVSVSNNVDTSAPTGKMVFTVLGAVAERDRSLIVEGVQAGIRNARPKGKPRCARADVRESQVEGFGASGGLLAQSPKR